MSAPDRDTHSRLLAVANRIAQLRPDGRNPEPFYEKRSDEVAELRAIANSPVMVKQVVRFVRIPAEELAAPAPAPPIDNPAAPAPAPAVDPPASPPPQLPSAPEGTMPIFLHAQECQVLARAVESTTGGFASAFKRWHAATDPVTGQLNLPQADLKRVWRWGSRPWKGGGQSYARKIFWRSVGGMFAALDMVPENGDVTAAPNPHRRYPKNAKPPENGEDTPPQDAPGGAGQRGGCIGGESDKACQDASDGPEEP